MATTEIAWGDGSGDKIYITSDAFAGDQSILVSSDANTGNARSKVVTFTSGVGGILRQLTVSQEAGEITPSHPCLTFKSTSTNTLSLSCNGTAAPALYYSTDGVTWTLWDYSAITFSKLYLYGNNTSGFSSSSDNYAQFVIDGDGTVECSGSIAALINGTDTLETIPCTYCFHSLFYGCVKLTKGPTLPSTTLKNYCYYQMFRNCDLVEAPELPATTLAQRCYSNMFRGCTSITAAPTLPALTLVSQCYHYMFYNCTNLSYVKAMFTTTPSTSYTSNWLNRVKSTGIFVKNSAATWTTTGVSGVPTGWTIQTESS